MHAASPRISVLTCLSCCLSCCHSRARFPPQPYDSSTPQGPPGFSHVLPGWGHAHPLHPLLRSGDSCLSSTTQSHTSHPVPSPGLFTLPSVPCCQGDALAPSCSTSVPLELMSFPSWLRVLAQNPGGGGALVTLPSPSLGSEPQKQQVYPHPAGSLWLHPAWLHEKLWYRWGCRKYL